MVAQYSGKSLSSFMLTATALLAASLVYASSMLPYSPSSPLSILVPRWTRSYQIYHQPHAFWLTKDEKPGNNLPILRKALKAAKLQQQQPEIAIYTIPFRDIGQSSEGGFKTYEDYLEDNRSNAKAIAKFIQQTGLHPRVYLEPDSIAHSIQYKREQRNNKRSVAVYENRMRYIPLVLKMYQKAGALVYLDAAHSGWFDYRDEDIAAIAEALNRAGIQQADGLTLNVSNRQPVAPISQANTELHYLKRLLPLLNNKKLDIIADTSRNGGLTKTRHFFLQANHQLIDNEVPEGRLVGTWKQDSMGEIWFKPFYGKKMPLSLLVGKDHFTWNAEARVLSAPHWLDPVGDVQPGARPQDHINAVGNMIHRFRYIKPPDECDGNLNYPPGASKSLINKKTGSRQKQYLATPSFWANIESRFELHYQ